MNVRSRTLLSSLTIFGFAGLLAVSLSACGSSKKTVKKAVTPDVTVGLREWAVTPDPITFKAGKVVIKAANSGGETHEMIVTKTASADALPKNPIGAVDEAQIAAADKAGEIPEMSPNHSSTKTFNLSAGTYVVYCNIQQNQPDGSVLSHFKLGMHNVITVQ